MINWKESNNLNRHISPRQLAEQQIQSLDNETIRCYAVLYAVIQNERCRREDSRNKESRAALLSFSSPRRKDDRVTSSAFIRARHDAAKTAAAEHVSRLVGGLVIRLTGEFLSTPISAGGMSVTWGTATREALMARRGLLFRTFSSNAETVARLDVAIGALTDSGAENLAALARTGVTEIGHATGDSAAVV
jgi:hypothetical protein